MVGLTLPEAATSRPDHGMRETVGRRGKASPRRTSDAGPQQVSQYRAFLNLHCQYPRYAIRSPAAGRVEIVELTPFLRRGWVVTPGREAHTLSAGIELVPWERLVSGPVDFFGSGSLSYSEKAKASRH
jgi:hypothetical protein